MTGNVHRLFGIFRFRTLADYEDLMAKAAADEELLRLEHALHELMETQTYDLYVTAT